MQLIHFTKKAGRLFLAIVAVSAVARGDGPVYREKGSVGGEFVADAVIDDFEGSTKYNYWVQDGQPVIRLTKLDAIGKDSTGSLQVEIDPPADPEGKSCAWLVWKFPTPQDWRGYGAVTLWQKALLEGTPDFWAVVTDGSGRWFRWRRDPDPSMLGEWRRIELPLQSSGMVWMPEGGGSKGPADLSSITSFRIRLWGRTAQPVKFLVDGISLEKAKPAYAGPIVQLRQSQSGVVRKPGDGAFEVTVKVGGLIAGQTNTLRIVSQDYWGTLTTLEKVNLPSGDATAWEKSLQVPNDRPGHQKIYAILSVDGADVYQDWIHLGSVIPQAPEDQASNPDSIFGIWVGGGQKRIGAKWTRYMFDGLGMKRTPDGQFQFRDQPPGEIKLPPLYGDDLSGRGLSYICSLVHTPPFLARGGATDGNAPPTDFDAYGAYVEWAIRGTKAAGFKYYELWNEPSATWRGSVEEFVKLCEVSYKAIKRVQPDAVVMGPASYGFTPEYHESFFKAGGGKWIDALSVHTYTPPTPEVGFRQGLHQLREIMAKYGLDKRDIYITEMGYSIPRVSFRQQAQFMVRAYLIALSEGVSVLNWHKLWNQDPKGSDGTELSERNGEPWPAYVAYAVMTRVLERAQYSGVVPGLTGTQNGLAFRKDENVIWVLWDDAASKVRLDLPAKDFNMIDIMGGEKQQQADPKNQFELTLGPDPVFLVLPSASTATSDSR